MNLQNLVDYCHEMGLPDPFSGATVPAPLNIDAVKSAIMIRCGLLTPLHGEPETFTNITTHWFFTKQWTFEHLINVIQSEYSPIENVFELSNEQTHYGHNNIKTGGYKDTEGGKDTVAQSGKDTTTISEKDTVANSGKDISELSGKDTDALTGTDTVALSGTDTTTNEISAFNAATYQADNKSSTTYGKSEGTTYGKTDTTTYGKKDTTTYGKTENTSISTTEGKSYGKTDTTTYNHTTERIYNSATDQEGGIDEVIKSRHGNIGVTTNQKMITEELELLRHFDIYSYIAKLFEEDNMLMIY